MRLVPQQTRTFGISKIVYDKPLCHAFNLCFSIVKLRPYGTGKGGELQLEAMGALYLKELEMASAAALGTYTRGKGEGDHKK